MPLTDVSRVTQAITTLVSRVLERDNFPDTVEVNAGPPEDDTSAAPNAISFHLFHIAEDPHTRNLLPSLPVTSPVPVGYTPMGLVLNYVATAHNTTATNASDRALIEQSLLGYVARALHDFPVITDSTVVATVPPSPPVFETVNLSGDDNRIDLTLRPATVEETVNFWSAEQDLTARLALFYEARVVLLSVQEVTSLAGIVYSLGGFVGVAGRPFVESVTSTLGFELPPGLFLPNPPVDQLLVANPARASLFTTDPLPAGVHPENNVVRIRGVHLRGEPTLLLLRGPAAVGAAIPEPRNIRIDISDPANSAWAFDVQGHDITAAVHRTVRDDTGATVALYPGPYSLTVIVARPIPGHPTGRRMEQSSNSVQFAVAPQIATVTNQGGPNSDHRFRITLYGSYLRDDLDIRLAVGGRTMERDADPTIAGNYDFAANSDQIDFAVDISTLSSPLPIDLAINGAGATPAWVVF